LRQFHWVLADINGTRNEMLHYRQTFRRLPLNSDDISYMIKTKKYPIVGEKLIQTNVIYETILRCIGYIIDPGVYEHIVVYIWKKQYK